MSATARGNNFDLLRLILAVLVVRCHGSLVGLNFPGTGDQYFLGGQSAVECFFVISGYLIFKSWQQQPRLSAFASKRARRILPAYLTVILGATFLLSMMSTLSFSEYLTNYETYRYLVTHLLFAGFLQNTLPGVFQDNFQTYVNGPLWTIKIEVWFYISVPIIAYLISRVHRAVGLAVIYVLAILWRVGFEGLAGDNQSGMWMLIAKQLPGQISFFISAGAIYYFKEQFGQNLKWLLPLSVIGVAAHYTYFNSPIAYALYPASLACLVIAIAEYAPFLGNWGKWGDFSYGIYIYHYPILQVFADLDPSHRYPIVDFVSASVCTFALAVVSWHCIEKIWLLKSSHYLQPIATSEERRNMPTELQSIAEQSIATTAESTRV